MTKKKTTAKAAAAKADKKNVTPEEVKGTPEVTGNDPKAEEVKDSVDKSNAEAPVEALNEAQDASKSESGTDAPEYKKNRSTASKKVKKKSQEELDQEEVEAENKKQFDEQNKLKAVAYNQRRDTRFHKFPKKISLADLEDRSKFPAEVGIESEILLSNGQIYTLNDGITSKFDKEALHSL